MNLSKAAIAQVMIPVDDFERGVAFYRDVKSELWHPSSPILTAINSR